MDATERVTDNREGDFLPSDVSNSNESSDAATPSAEPSTTTVEDVIDEAIRAFSAKGFDGVKLEKISKNSGMSKRMIHYHFTDKRGLYLRALTESVSRTLPTTDDFDTSSAVPVEGVRAVADAMFASMINHPVELRLLMHEGLDDVMALNEMAPIINNSASALHLERLIMLGQDSGAFRPGIAAHDIFGIIAAFATYRQVSSHLLDNLYGIDMQCKRNTEGLHRMTIDAILAFLTANIPDAGERAYLHSSLDEEDEAQSDIYS